MGNLIYILTTTTSGNRDPALLETDSLELYKHALTFLRPINVFKS